MAAEIGAFVHIGNNVVIGRSVIIKSCVQILPNTIVPHDAVIPPFSIVGGNPGMLSCHLVLFSNTLDNEVSFLMMIVFDFFRIHAIHTNFAILLVK